jgi:hypothetical protein
VKTFWILAAASVCSLLGSHILAFKGGPLKAKAASQVCAASADGGTSDVKGGPLISNGCVSASEGSVCKPLVFVADDSVCARNASTFASDHGPPSWRDRKEAERWLAYYPQCESYLNAKIAQLQEQIVNAATEGELGAAAADGGTAPQDAGTPDGGTAPTPTRGQIAACKLRQYKHALVKAQIDRHTAYDVIHDELHAELDYATWLQQFVVGGTILGGAGGARDLGIDLRFDTRPHYPAGFRFSLSLGAHKHRNLLSLTAPSSSTSNDLALGRDPKPRWAVPALATLSWSWIQSSIFVGGGGSWVPDGHHAAIVGQLGIGFLQSWLNNNRDSSGGFVSEARFLVEPWIPLDNSGPTSILFGLELGLGVGYAHSSCNPEHPTRHTCHPTNENFP